MAAFDKFVGQLEGQTAKTEQQASGAVQTIVGGVTNLVKDRWWKKEFDEFKESDYPQEMKHLLKKKSILEMKISPT